MHDPPHIMIIDADSSAAQVTRTLVERIDPLATIIVEHTAERGRLRARQDPPDILIIDSSLNTRSDEQLIKQIKAEVADARIIVLTTASSLMIRRRMYELGIDLCIEKLAAPTPLINGLRAMLQPTRSGLR